MWEPLGRYLSPCRTGSRRQRFKLKSSENDAVPNRAGTFGLEELPSRYHPEDVPSHHSVVTKTLAKIG
ncbi:hypothetical protein K443DRAFT_678298 [Laccaria amethystina LaAM-08-1]|uniref:Uncharacterized protein n=1 Tax=Laccaria amethystina LaAM-08-1 TaxID=1095629 RepID=A0A0C9Y0I1_9AGAR|nr:hypothetical protein K443DRAFT_678298 [Laccaria amethystina LaAM-08-1]